MKTSAMNIHYHWLIIGILTATLWLTVSATDSDYPTECPKMDPFNYTVLLPHESECTKFYACNHGRKILMLCALMDNLGNRLHFNNEIHVCDYPDRAGCKMQSSSTTTNKPTTSTESTTSNNPTSSTTPKHSSSSSTEASTSKRPMITTTKKPKSSTEASTSHRPMTTTTNKPKSSTEVSTNNTSSTEIVTSSTTEQSAESSTTNEPSTTPTSEGPTAPAETTVTNLPAETTTESSTNPNDVSTINPSTTMTIISSTTEQSTSSTGSSITESTIMTSTSESQTSSTELSPTMPITTTTAELPTTITTMETPTETTQLPSNPTNTDITTDKVPTTTGLPMTSSEITLPTSSSEINLPTTTTEEIETSTIQLLSTPTCTNKTTDVYFPHESHSGLYYECRYGDLIRRECKDNLIFDVSQQTCVLPLETNLLLKLTNAQLIDESTSSTKNNVNLCDVNDSNGNYQRYSHEFDCTKYYICINGNAVLRMCPSRLNFNSKLKECDLPSNANCSGDNNNPNNIMPNKCPLDNSGWAINLPHETNCSLFYKCNWGEKIKLSCKSGLYFNPTLQICDYPCAAGCTVEGGSGTNTCHNSTIISGNEEQFKQKPILSRKTFKNLASIIHNQ
ncbi:hypothetical protein PV325_013122 [Microctonus aethiopoides]|uniref:Chitin-binding type-2 domain-containing protein n=1 Tax=Microctonus aethiopoides TaxID=144406 RepID=A0AA39KSA4_9HYME|nr:hypothetical protein PV325_013122 [Microctonus aethiopoides]KAK0171879.1 hypothetical protein PV328_005272 [Microctonus aethiopoides]